MADPSPSDVERALAAIRDAKGNVARVSETWTVEHAGRRDIFIVDAGMRAVESGDAYTTWLVSFGAGGTLLGVERFTSRACRPLR